MTRYNFKRGDIILLFSQWFKIRKRRAGRKSRMSGAVLSGGDGKCSLCEQPIAVGDLYLGHPDGDITVNSAFQYDYADRKKGHAGVCVTCGIKYQAEISGDTNEDAVMSVTEMGGIRATHNGKRIGYDPFDDLLHIWRNRNHRNCIKRIRTTSGRWKWEAL